MAELPSGLVEVVKLTDRPTLALALENYIAHCTANGTIYKISVQGFIDYIAPKISALGASGFVAVNNNTLPDLSTDNNYSIVPSGTYTQTGEASLVLTGVLNIISWNGTAWSLVKEVDVDLSDYATKSDLANGVLSFKVDSITYENPRGSSELYGNEAWFSDTDGGKNGIGAYIRADNDIDFNSISFSAAQIDTSKTVTVRVYTSSTKTSDLNAMILFEEVVFPAGSFNSNVDFPAVIDLQQAYTVISGDWLYVMAYSSGMSWKFWNAQSAPPLRETFLYTTNNNDNPFNIGGWGFAVGNNYQAGLSLNAVNKDLKKRFDALDGVPNMFIPSKVYAKKETPSVLYFNNFIMGYENEENYYGFKVAADWNFRGSSLYDCFYVKPNSADSSGQNLTFRFYNLYKKLIAIKNTSLIVVDNTGLKNPKKVIQAGNSKIAPGWIIAAVQDNINALGADITLYGTSPEGIVPNEGYSGKNIAWFVHDPASPFTNGSGVLDIPAYFSSLGVANVDLFDFMEMTNTIGSTPQAQVPEDFPYTDAMNDLKSLFTALLNAGVKRIIYEIEDPQSLNATILEQSVDFVFAPLWTKQNFTHNMFVFVKRILENFDNNAFDSRVSVGFAGAYISRDYGYERTEVVVNPRFPDDKRFISYDITHPNIAGFQSMGDGITPQILFHLQELDD